MPAISLIIPCYNEAAFLPRLLTSVDAARRAFSARAGAPKGGQDAAHGCSPAAQGCSPVAQVRSPVAQGRSPVAQGFSPADDVEVIVSDNASTDATAQLAADHGCRVVSSTVRRIGAVRNAGAAAARGGIIAFIDADSQIHADTFNVIAALMARPDVIGGSTGARMERWSAGIAMTYAMLVPIVWATTMDIGVVFCRRADFEAIGGYDGSMQFAEDVKFLWDLRRRGRQDGRRLVRARAVKVIASTRKFDTFGDWHYLTMVLKLPWHVLNRRARQAFADRYWYKPDR